MNLYNQRFILTKKNIQPLIKRVLAT